MIGTLARMVAPLTARVAGALLLLAPALVAAAVPVGPSVAGAPVLPTLVGATPTVCWWLAAPKAAAKGKALSAPAAPPEYYGFPIVSTRRVPGTGQAKGVGRITFVTSPFGFAVAPDGSYQYDLILESERLAAPREGVYVVWVTTPSLDQVRLMGTLDEQGGAQIGVEWNKFLVVVTLEPVLDPAATIWSGPIIMRGMSRSGMMHTMAGHGPFETENCAIYGY